MTAARAKTSLPREAAVAPPSMEAPEMTKLRLTRTARGAAIALVFALVVAAPAAASQPTRTVTHFTGDRVAHFPAGDGCTFDVTVYLSTRAHVTVTEFSD